MNEPYKFEEPIIPLPMKGRAQGLAALIATRIAIQELVKDHNTHALIKSEVFGLKSLAGMPEYDQPQIQCKVKDDLTQFTITYEFYRSDTDEAHKFREQREEYHNMIVEKFKNWKAARTAISRRMGGEIEK